MHAEIDRRHRKAFGHRGLTRRLGRQAIDPPAAIAMEMRMLLVVCGRLHQRIAADAIGAHGLAQNASVGQSIQSAVQGNGVHALRQGGLNIGVAERPGSLFKHRQHRQAIGRDTQAQGRQAFAPSLLQRLSLSGACKGRKAGSGLACLHRIILEPATGSIAEVGPDAAPLGLALAMPARGLERAAHTMPALGSTMPEYARRIPCSEASVDSRWAAQRLPAVHSASQGQHAKAQSQPRYLLT